LENDPMRRHAARIKSWLVAATVAATLLPGVRGACSEVPASGAVAKTDALLFEHVNVVPMDRERVLRDQSVLVEGGTITAIGRDVAAPAGTRVIDGHGTDYLSPGLADMHVHSSTRRDMAVLLANGVTSVLNMGGATPPFVDQVVPRLNRGEIPGPHVYLALRVDGTPDYGHLVVATPDQARALVGIAKTNGYDFIKVYDDLAPDVFRAFVDEGRSLGLPVVGHGVTRVGIEQQLASGQLMVAHAEEYLYTSFFPAGADVGNRAPRLDQIPAVVAFTKRYGAYVTADLDTYATIAQQWGKPEVVKAFLAAPTTAYLDPDDRIAWRSEDYVTRSGSLADRLAFLKQFIVALQRAGVPLVAGTDSPSIPGLVPGFALHQDLRALQAAGLSPFEALSAATRTPGRMIAEGKPGSQSFGTLGVGTRADLILSAANPLVDLSTLEHPLGVAAAGHWHDAQDLASMLARVAATYCQADSSGPAL
jgi:imidazolonepropionase-like amidohydrolase